MNRLTFTLNLWKARLLEARVAILVLGPVFLVVIGYLVLIALRPDRATPFGTERLGDDVICREYGDGGLVCFPAPDKVTELREDQRRRLNDPAK